MGGWSMKNDRDLIKMAHASRSSEQIAYRLDVPLPSVLKAAKRLGINLGPQRPRADGRFKVKGK